MKVSLNGKKHGMNITVPIGIFLVALPVLAISGPPKSESAPAQVSAEEQRILVDTLDGFATNRSETFGGVITVESDDEQLQNVSDVFLFPVNDPVVSDAYGVIKPLS